VCSKRCYGDEGCAKEIQRKSASRYGPVCVCGEEIEGAPKNIKMTVWFSLGVLFWS